jgi:hypothetical protein
MSFISSSTSSLSRFSAGIGRMKTLLIVYYSRTGGTRPMAEAAATGASAEPGVDVRLLEAAAVGPDDVLAADGYILPRRRTSPRLRELPGHAGLQKNGGWP